MRSTHASEITELELYGTGPGAAGFNDLLCKVCHVI